VVTDKGLDSIYVREPRRLRLRYAVNPQKDALPGYETITHYRGMVSAHGFWTLSVELAEGDLGHSLDSSPTTDVWIVKPMWGTEVWIYFNHLGSQFLEPAPGHKRAEVFHADHAISNVLKLPNRGYLFKPGP
jgi:hypothetical protein